MAKDFDGSPVTCEALLISVRNACDIALFVQSLAAVIKYGFLNIYVSVSFLYITKIMSWRLSLGKLPFAIHTLPIILLRQCTNPVSLSMIKNEGPFRNV